MGDKDLWLITLLSILKTAYGSFSGIRGSDGLSVQGRLEYPCHGEEDCMKYEWIDEYLLKMQGVTKDLQKDWNWIRYQIGKNDFIINDPAMFIFFYSVGCDKCDPKILFCFFHMTKQRSPVTEDAGILLADGILII